MQGRTLARKVLLADDSVTAQNMGRRILSDAGYEVITVNNGSAALKKIAELQPDLVILDVYMPVYSGLEVCQRLKEAPATSGLPVLLTVGKLEPFKAEEARRVKADGHLIKPFEASQLLKALAKLEERIVPRPQSPLPERSSKAAAAGSHPPAIDSKGESKESKETKEIKEFKDGGWKTLVARIPEPTAEPERAGNGESQSRESSDVGFSDLSLKAASEISPVKSQSVEFQPIEPQSIEPQPIEPQAVELQSIEPQSIESQSVESQSEVERELVREKQEFAKADSRAGTVTLPSASDTGIAKARPEVAIEEMAPDVQSTLAEPPSELPRTANPQAEPEERAAEAESSSLPPLSSSDARAKAAQMQSSLEGDAEVLAALAALVNESGFGDKQPEVAALAFASASEMSGPRWVVASVPLADDESALILEHEMEKARAYLAIAEASPVPTNCAGIADEPDALPATPTRVDAFDRDDLGEAKVAIVASEIVASDEASDRAHSAWPGQSETNPTLRALNPEVAVTESETTVPVSPTTTAVGAQSQEATETQSAYAAAASAAGATLRADVSSANTSSVEATLASAATTTPVGEPDNPVQARQPASELASAWQSWKQIRDTVASSQPPGETAEAAAKEQNEVIVPNSGEPSPAVSPEANDASESEVQTSSSLESIVDSVLADLRPKLLEEIARKMAKARKN